MSAERKRGSFFKLIESFAIELGTLKKEMGHRSRDPTESVDQDVGGLFPHGSPGSGRCSGVSSGPSPSPSGPSGLRDSGYSGSLHRKLTVLERLIHTHSVWLQLTLDQQGALQLLQTQPPGTFVVRRSSSLQRKVLCVRMDSDSVPVQEFSVSESQYSFSLEDSALRFADVFRLVAFCCISRDVLPFILKLPEPIASARTRTELDHISKQGPGFWDTCKRKTSSVPPPLPPPSKTITDLTISTISAPLNLPKIYTRTPSELECSQSNGALCFINPLFVKVHHEDRETSQIATTPDPEGGDGDAKLDQFSKDTSQSPRSPCPPRPPPPRFFNAKLSRAQSMPEKVQWVKEKPEGRDRKNREGSFLSRLSSSLSISPSSSPPTKISHISSPISIPNQTAVLSLAAFSSSPRRVFQMSPSSSSQEDAAMEDHIIERALRRARLRRVRLQRTGTSKDKDEAGDANANGRQDGESQMDVTDAGRNGGQRLSDLSLSTDSSDSLDFSQSSSFFFPPMHDPKPPTLAEIDAHLPMSLPQFCTSLDYDEDEEEDYEEEDYGVSLESDQEEQEQDQDVTMEPPGRRGGRHRGSASAVVIQKALKGQLRKMSGVFNSLLTPEKRAVRRVLELSRDKRTYFGGLVQDFLGYMSDQGQEQGLGLGLDSASELLQTVRQFLTQMKSYLRQSSELEPPIESLIPEEQIGESRSLSLLSSLSSLSPLYPLSSPPLPSLSSLLPSFLLSILSPPLLSPLSILSPPLLSPLYPLSSLSSLLHSSLPSLSSRLPSSLLSILSPPLLSPLSILSPPLLSPLYPLSPLPLSPLSILSPPLLLPLSILSPPLVSPLYPLSSTPLSPLSPLSLPSSPLSILSPPLLSPLYPLSSTPSLSPLYPLSSTPRSPLYPLSSPPSLLSILSPPLLSPLSIPLSSPSLLLPSLSSLLPSSLPSLSSLLPSLSPLYPLSSTPLSLSILSPPLLSPLSILSPPLLSPLYPLSSTPLSPLYPLSSTPLSLSILSLPSSLLSILSSTPLSPLSILSPPLLSPLYPLSFPPLPSLSSLLPSSLLSILSPPLLSPLSILSPPLLSPLYPLSSPPLSSLSSLLHSLSPLYPLSSTPRSPLYPLSSPPLSSLFFLLHSSLPSLSSLLPSSLLSILSPLPSLSSLLPSSLLSILSPPLPSSPLSILSPPLLSPLYPLSSTPLSPLYPLSSPPLSSLSSLLHSSLPSLSSLLPSSLYPLLHSSLPSILSPPLLSLLSLLSLLTLVSFCVIRFNLSDHQLVSALVVMTPLTLHLTSHTHSLQVSLLTCCKTRTAQNTFLKSKNPNEKHV
uniref:SH2 domain-containing protein n=1 Tax=Knipowitschia caucasica TaxID=637954 RepID=A0AAV2JI35_KNICA